jgi:sodium/proline symporter
MARSSVVTLVLLAFVALLLVMATWAARRTHHAADYLIASRRLGVWLTAFGFIGNATNAWTLLLLGAAAFTWGLSAIWLWAAMLFGALISMWYVAPRLQSVAAAQNSTTVTQVISADAGDRLQPLITRSAAFIALVFLLLQISIALRAAATLLQVDSAYDLNTSVFVFAAVVAGCVLAGGLRAASLCDAVQVIVMLVAALLLPLPAIVFLASWDSLLSSLAVLGPATSDWFGGKSGVVALAFAVGAFGLGFAVPGQPHAMVRFLAAKDEAVLRRARWIALAWMVVSLGAVLICGWCARLLYDGLQHPEQALFALARRLLPPSIAAVFVTSLVWAIVLSTASPMLAIASQFAVEFRRAAAPLSLAWSRFAVVVTAILAIIVSLFIPLGLVEQGLLALTALGAAFGPLLLVRLSGKRIRPGSALGAMWAGFILTLLFHLLPDSPGDFLERVLPFVAALGIALTGGERRRNPDRADRSQETVHDRVPI